VARYQRWNALLDLLPGDGQLTVAEAARALSVSEATIRRDLDQLAKQQLVTRTRGGATAGHVSYDLPLRYKTARHGPEKQRIGRAAAALPPKKRRKPVASGPANASASAKAIPSRRFRHRRLPPSSRARRGSRSRLKARRTGTWCMPIPAMKRRCATT